MDMHEINSRKKHLVAFPLETRGNPFTAAIFVLGHAPRVDLVRSVSDTQRPHMRVGLSQESILADAHAAMRLNSTVDYSAGHVGHHHLLGKRNNRCAVAWPFVLLRIRYRGV